MIPNSRYVGRRGLMLKPYTVGNLSYEQGHGHKCRNACHGTSRIVLLRALDRHGFDPTCRLGFEIPVGTYV